MYRELLTCLLIASAVGAQDDAAKRKPDSGHVDGVTISTRGAGEEWASDRMKPAIEDISKLGAGWIATHPYAWIRNNGEVRYRTFRPDKPPEQLVRPIREAHALGLKVLIKPHLGYWGSKFSWRGEIQFDEPEERERFWSSYERWIVDVAAACHDADAIAVGTELDRMLDPKRWRQIIAKVRAKTRAPLTYAANWTDYQRVEFWDALDVIGVQAYFPLCNEPTADEVKIRAGWKRRMSELRHYASEQKRHIVFTELGYNQSLQAAVEPWNNKMDRSADGLRTQRTCMRIALEEVRSEPLVVGSFLWKWFPGPGRRRRVHDFHIKDDEMKKVIAGVWRR